LAKIESGRHENASEAVRAALRTLERDEREYEVKLAALRTAIDAGDSSGIAQAIPSHVYVRSTSFPQKRRQARGGILFFPLISSAK
jgi:putative addiction module CopG family antidote